ncbi:MAG: hypothetical protein GXO40_06105 [Epsilonproteobacteria bacterium]|nr:hypothetical protein [Campylobacterota bacterium]
MWIAFGIICMFVGLIAYKKFNRSFWIWSFAAFFFSPLFTLLFLLLLEYVINTTPESFSRKMLDLHKLYKNGMISQEEYEYQKNVLIAKIRTPHKEEFLAKITPLVQNGVLNQDDVENIKRSLYGLH